MTSFKIDMEIILSILNILLAIILLYSSRYALKKFRLSIFKKPWYLFILVSILMIVGSAIRLYISWYDDYSILWISRGLDFIQRLLLIIGIYMLASVTIKLWGD
jgi:hypothetical protein